MVAMAKHQLATIPLIFGLVLSNLISTFGKLECEDLPVENCAFSVASSGTRCVLEKYKGKDDSMQYECQSSIIMAEKQEEWIESDECVKSCGLERMSVGLSTDLLMDSHFTEMLCSSECLNNCPNLIDLYISLAAGEGVTRAILSEKARKAYKLLKFQGMYLPQLCKTHRMSSRRVIADPVKKAIDAEYQRSLLPRLTSGGAMAPGASQTPESGAGTGAGTPPADGLQKPGPDFRGYVGGSGGVGTSGEIAPTSPVPGSTTPPLEKAPAAQTPTAGGPSTNKRPFFIASYPPTPSRTIQSTPVAATPETGAVEPPETAPFISASAPEMAPAPSPEQGSEDLYWQQLSAEKVMPDRSQLNDEEYLYETYFH